MPIRPILAGNNVFSPEDVATITTAFEDTLRTLRLVDRSDPAVTIVAKRMISVAMTGERDLISLRDAVLKSLRNDPGASGL
jgi:hypothetical protein